MADLGITLPPADKVQNRGATQQGRLTSIEYNRLVLAVSSLVDVASDLVDRCNDIDNLIESIINNQMQPTEDTNEYKDYFT